MIAHVRGKVASIQQNAVVVDVSGVGFLVYVGAHTLEALREGSDTTLSTFLVVREDKMELYGFLREAEKRFFEQLLKVSAVGPKTALSILSLGNLAEVQQAIVHGDAALLSSAQGVGKKTAERIILELKEKIFAEIPGEKPSSGSHAEGVIGALQNLGYSAKEARVAVKDMPRDLQSDDDRLRWVLKHLGS